MDWKDVFYYSESSSSSLRRIHPLMGGKGHKVMFAPAGAEVGSLNKEGYYKVKHDGKNYACHRIVYELVHGDCEGYEVDHINGDSTDNRPENLRKVSKTLNMRNRRKSDNNTSGTTGVYLRTVKHKGVEYAAWMAQWVGIDGARTTRTFSTKKYGNDEARELAGECRAKAIAEVNAAGAGYTERHGGNND